MVADGGWPCNWQTPPSLNRDGRYAIRLANEGIAFDEANGWNILAEDVEIREH